MLIWSVVGLATGLAGTIVLITWYVGIPQHFSLSVETLVYLLLLLAVCFTMLSIIAALTSRSVCRDIACLLEALASGDTEKKARYASRTHETLNRSVDRLSVMLTDSNRQDEKMKSEASQLKERTSGLEEMLINANADLKQKEMRLREINSELVAANKAKSEFISNMSREFRLPLNTIVGLSDFIRQGGLGEVNDKQRDYLEKISARAENILYMVTHVLQYSDQRSCENLEFEDVELKRFTDELISSLSQYAASKNVDMQSRVQEAPLRADMEKLRYVVYDLMHNAIKFNMSGGRAVLSVGPADPGLVMDKLELKPDAAGGDQAGAFVEFTVTDTGPGIPEPYRNNLFRPFCQIPDDTGGARGGAGLSLYLARKIVELHGGRIWMDNAAGGGTSFGFIIPSASCEGSSSGVRKKRKVIIAEDDPAQMDILLRFLKDDEFEIHTAMDGIEALRLTDEVTPDLFLLDVMMPKMDGITVCSLLKQQERFSRFRHVPVVIATSLADIENKVLAIKAGADDVLSKPINRKLLKERVKALLETKDEYDNILASYRHAEKDATVDPLTGLYNRRYMEDIMEREFMSSRRHGRDLTVLMMDLDHFKDYNDRLGHQAGDGLLKEVSRKLRQIVREVDVVARYGGEEFIAILPETPPDMGAMVAERIRSSVEEDTGVTISVGMASYPEDSKDISGLVRNADDALYAAKNAGRNRVVAYGEVSARRRIA